MIYADVNATYPIDPRHYERVATLLKEVDGNPSSIHARGRSAKIALEDARASVARLLGARPNDVIFTSGATEANNLAIYGSVLRGPRGAPPPHVIVTAAEHKAVLEPAQLLAERGLCQVDIAPVRPSGEVDASALMGLLRHDTALVCILHANNETGVVNPVYELADQIKEKAAGVHMHVDAVQMLGKADLTRYARSAIDSAAFSAHKIGAYKGVGALLLKSSARLGLLLAGGGQERGRRPGTENLPGIVSFGLRCDEVRHQEAQLAGRMRPLREAWLAALATIPGAVVHGSGAEMLPNTVNFHVDGVPGDDILLNFDLAGILASSGSACSSGVARPSHVLMAMGYPEWVALNSVRISFPAEMVLEDVFRMAGALREIVDRARH